MWRRYPKSKYGATRVQASGYSFASKLEAAVHQILLLRERAGEIQILGVQKQVRLTEAGIIYKPDFEFVNLETGIHYYCEAKGFETPEWKLKLKLYRFYGPRPLEIWQGSAISPKLVETVIPKGLVP